jgi:hypothetical protein
MVGSTLKVASTWHGTNMKPTWKVDLMNPSDRKKISPITKKSIEMLGDF